MPVYVLRCVFGYVFFGLANCFVAGVLEEAKFFGISKAIEPLESLIQTEELAVHGQFTRKEFLRMLSITSSSSTLRCQVNNSLLLVLSDSVAN